MRGIRGYERKLDYGEWENHYRLIRRVPFAMDNPPHAKRDLIGWDISRDQHLRNAFGRDERWRLMPTNNTIYNMIWQLLRTNPMLFGDFLFSYSRKPYRPVLRNNAGRTFSVDEHEHGFMGRSTFGEETIKNIFQQETPYEICLGLLPMLISQLELMLLHELKKDDENVIRMVQQYDTYRRGHDFFASEPDRQRLLDAREALIKKNEAPSWKPKTSTIPLGMYPVRRWNFEPLQEFTMFPDRYDLGYRLLRKLIGDFRNLESAGRKRREQFESKLIGLTDRGEIARLYEAAAAGVTLFADSDSESKWILRNEQRDIRDRIKSFIGFWIKLFFDTPAPIAVDNVTGEYPADGSDIVRGTRLAEKFFDLMFSPTNFYMPEFIIARPQRGVSAKAPKLPQVGEVTAPPLTRDETPGATVERRVNPEGGARPGAQTKTPRELQFERLFARWAERLLGPADTWDAFPA